MAVCRQHNENEVEEMSMKRFNMRKFAVVVAAAVLCLGLSVGALAGGSGWFKDVIGWDGAIIGTEYMQADEEIQLSLAVEDDMLTVSVAMAEKVPYNETEFLSMGVYEICDAEDNVILQGEGSDKAAVENYAAKLLIPLDELEEGNYKLKVVSFVSEKKADADLSIYGTWECEFVK